MNFDPEKYKSIIDYYHQTEFDYKVGWDNSENPEVHFGDYDHNEALSNTNKILAELVNIQEGEKVLDAGCGRGGSCFWIARNKKANVVGVTPVPNQIRECNEKANEFQLSDRTEFLLGDYCDTQLPDCSFDVVWAIESVCHTQCKLDFYKEVYRLLKPGGRLVMAEYIRKKRSLLIEEEDLLRVDWLNKWAISDIDTKEEHIENAGLAGFKSIDVSDYTISVKVSLRNAHEKASRFLPVAIVLRLLRFRSKIQHGNTTASIKQYEALKKNLWFYGVITAKKEKY